MAGDLRRLNRMVEILSKLNRGEKLTPKGLADHFGVGERTILRDMQALVVDFEIYYDRQAESYRFTEGHTLKKLDLSADEVRVLLASRAMLSKMGEGVAGGYEKLLKRLKAESGKKTDQRLKSAASNLWVDIDPVEDFSRIRKQYDALQKALDEKETLEIRYKRMGDQKETVRKIDPYGLFFSSGVWYTLAYCHERKDIREFALDCIKAVKGTDSYYAILQDFSMEKYFEAGWHIVRYGEPVEIRLRFTKDVARWITRRKWHHTQKIENKKDGSIIFTVTLSGTEEIRRWVYHWGANCEVLSPPEFRKEVSEELKDMLQVYEKKMRKK